MHKGYTLRQLSEWTRSTLVGDPDKVIFSVDTLDAAEERDLSFLSDLRYRKKMWDSKAGAICVGRDVPLIEGRDFLICEEPSVAFQRVVEKLYSFDPCDTGFEGVHPRAVVHESAILGENVTVGPCAVIAKGSVIGDNTRIFPSAFVGAEVKIGKGCIIYSGVIIRERCSIGDRVILQPNAVIGSCGYGYVTDAKTGEHVKLAQLGSVVLEDDVEVGACATIDRARFKRTVVGRGAKIDNQVQIAHNVELGENVAVAALSGIAGSTKVGRNVSMGGQVGVVGHIEIADGVAIAARGGVSKSLERAGIYKGSPVLPLGECNRQQVLLRRIGDFVREIETLKKRIEELEKGVS